MLQCKLSNFYRLVGVDAYSFEQKIHHIAQHIQLPEAPKVGPDLAAAPKDNQIPPLLILNIQLPTYKVSQRKAPAEGFRGLFCQGNVVYACLRDLCCPKSTQKR